MGRSGGAANAAAWVPLRGFSVLLMSLGTRRALEGPEVLPTGAANGKGMDLPAVCCMMSSVPRSSLRAFFSDIN